MPGPIPTTGAAGPITQAAALANANTLITARGLDSEHAARVRVEYLDTWANRWAQPIPAGKNYE